MWNNKPVDVDAFPEILPEETETRSVTVTIDLFDFYLLEMDDKIVNKPSAMVNGKIQASDEPYEFDTPEEADEYGALLLSTGQGTFYTVLNYTRLA